MVESELPVICPECGMRAQVRLKPSGPENVLNDTVTICARGKEGMAIMACPPLRQVILGAQSCLRQP
jgi:hypothetical protein